jgi:hypothetical protein
LKIDMETQASRENKTRGWLVMPAAFKAFERTK